MEQSKALEILKSGKNVFLTGSAGTGKTYVLNQYIQHLKDSKVPVAITASTGIAATHMGGVTIHSWCGIGVKEEISDKDLKKLGVRKDFKKKLIKAKVLIIDEISMLHKNQLDAVNRVVQFFRESPAAFGRLQVVLCGDFFQLPPIGKYGERSKDKFAFMSEAWQQAAFNVCYLTEQYRQSDNDLNTLLNEIRTGEVSEISMNLLRHAQTNKLDERHDPTKLYTHNMDVDRVNTAHLNDLEGKKRVFRAKTTGKKALVETLKKSVLASSILELKIGAKVMFVKNNPDKGYINGTLGKVEKYSSIGLPMVKTMDNKVITVAPEKWGIEEDTGKALASFNQIPLRLAWAITVHKCQGMTLDAVEIDLSKTFEKGQGYVALSRLKEIENLQLLGINSVALQVDALAQKADIRFQELSNEAEDKYSLDDLGEAQKLFVRTAGGRNLSKIDDDDIELENPYRIQ